MASSAGVSLGPMLVGFVLDTILYGVVITQTLVYSSCYKSDGPWLKSFVALLFALDTINVALEFLYMYDTFIIHFGDASVVMQANWMFSTVPATTGVTSALVQLFFAWRMKVLRQNKLLIFGIISLALTGMLCGIGTGIAVNLVPTFTEFHRFESIAIMWLSASAADNLLITSALVWSLREYRTGFADTDHIIKKIIRITLHTGLLTAIWTIIDLSVYLAMTNGMHLIFVLPLAKFYTNSLLSTLISRTRDPTNVEFTVVDGSRHSERRADLIQLDPRAETVTRQSEIIFEAIGVKKLQDHGTSITQDDHENR